MTYGSMTGSSLKNFELFAKKLSLKFHYVNELLMIDNFLPGFNINLQLRDEYKKNIAKNLDSIEIDIKHRRMNIVKPKSLLTKLFSYMVRRSFDITGKEDTRFNVDKSCIACAVCAKVCPKGNITIEDKPIYHHKCSYCMACIHACPIAAIHIKSEKNNKRFRNKSIKIQEIIDSNNQQ
jgi:ferredoxin